MDNLEIFDTKHNNRKRIIIAVISVLIVIALAFATAMILKTYVLSTIPVGGDSMLPTLIGGEYEVDANGNVTKTIRKGDTLLLSKVAKVKRGDIVVFDVKDKIDPLVKRVIAVAGDTVEIRDGAVFLNGERLNESYTQGLTYSLNGEAFSMTVPTDCVFCLGDNRENSHDSRSNDIGAVPLSSIRGKCILILDNDGGIRIPK